MVHAYVVRPLSGLLRQGITPERLAVSISCGITVGICPLVGTTTAACTMLAILLRLNLLAMQLGNWLVWPVQIALVVPFLVMGDRLFGPGRLVNIERIAALLRDDALLALQTVSRVVIHAAAAWAVCAPFVFVVLYGSFVFVFRRMKGRPYPSS